MRVAFMRADEGVCGSETTLLIEKRRVIEFGSIRDTRLDVDSTRGLSGTKSGAVRLKYVLRRVISSS